MAEVQSSALVLRFAQPAHTARGVFTERPGVILELRDADGLAGYGEAAPWPGFGMETCEESLGALRGVARLLRGPDLEPAEWTASLAAHLQSTPAARAALEGALWDLAARRAQRPLAQVLSARCVRGGWPALERVAASVLLMEDSPDALRAEAVRVREAGFRAAKLKLGASPIAEDVARATAARDGLGPAIQLRGDANGAWSERQAHEALEALASCGFAYVEQPLPPDAIEAMARLRRSAAVRIAADESVASPAGAARVIDTGAADVVVLKPAMLGGPAQALAIAARARRAGCTVVFTHAFESAVGAHHVLHCAAAWGDPSVMHGVGTEGLFVDDVADPVVCRNGEAEVPSLPGLGLTL